MRTYKFNVVFFDAQLAVAAESKKAAIQQVRQMVSGAIDTSAVPVKHRLYLEGRDWEGETVYLPVEEDVAD